MDTRRVKVEKEEEISFSSFARSRGLGKEKLAQEHAEHERCRQLEEAREGENRRRKQEEEAARLRPALEEARKFLAEKDPMKRMAVMLVENERSPAFTMSYDDCFSRGHGGESRCNKQIYRRGVLYESTSLVTTAEGISIIGLKPFGRLIGSASLGMGIGAHESRCAADRLEAAKRGHLADVEAIGDGDVGEEEESVEEARAGNVAAMASIRQTTAEKMVPLATENPSDYAAIRTFEDAYEANFSGGDATPGV
jgi:hypothetical protein